MNLYRELTASTEDARRLRSRLSDNPELQRHVAVVLSRMAKAHAKQGVPIECLPKMIWEAIEDYEQKVKGLSVLEMNRSAEDHHLEANFQYWPQYVSPCKAEQKI